MTRPRLLIEEWLPAQAIGMECMRERSTGQQPPDKRLHVWWARRPLTVSRAAVLASLLPADFDRSLFERLLGFYASSNIILENERKLEVARLRGTRRISNPHGSRAFASVIPIPDIEASHEAMMRVWGKMPTVIDPMAGGGSIPLETARLGLNSLANEYNPVACSVLEATVDYPFRFGVPLAEKARKWGKEWLVRFRKRMDKFYDADSIVPVYSYIFARTVPCPDYGYATPLVPDWALLKPKGGKQLVAVPDEINKAKGTWTIAPKFIGTRAGEIRQPPHPSYGDGGGISIFSNKPIPPDYIKIMAQRGKMDNVLYAVVTKATSKLEFRPATSGDLESLEKAQKEIVQLRPEWERKNIIPTETYPVTSTDERPRLYGMPRWADMFSPRQLLAMGVLVEELQNLRGRIIDADGEVEGEAIIHLLAFVIDKLANHNCYMSRWDPSYPKIASTFDRHDFSFKPTWAEMAACVPSGGLEWAIENVIHAYEKLAKLPSASETRPVSIAIGSATNLMGLDDRSITAVVVDPPYADNVQYSELANFFYVWLKRTQGHRHPDWFSTYLCEQDQEAVVNISRHRDTSVKVEKGKKNTDIAEAKRKANKFYQQLIADSFKEAKRILRDDGVLTVMFTHKKQEAWAALFESLILAGFTITATWPVQTESQHSLHQAKKNAAQSTVVLVARKREENAGRGYFDDAMKSEIRQVAQKSASRLRNEGLNAVDQLVGAFGPAMEVFTRYEDVRTDTGDKVNVIDAIQSAADAVADWRVEQLAKRGLEGVDAQSRFALLCWDVLGAAEFRFNEAMLLGRSVGMDVSRLKETGLVTTGSDKVKILPAKERRRERPVKTEQEQQMALFEMEGKRKKKASRKIHPNDEYFVSAIDMCHALALRYAEAKSEQAGIGAAKGMALQQGWNTSSPCARMMVALVNAAPRAVQFPGGGKKKTTADEFPEFRAWHAMLKPLFGIEPPEWKVPTLLQPSLAGMHADEEEIEETENEEAEE